MEEKKQDDGIDRGEIRTEFTRSHSDIKAGGITMCKDHKWGKRNECELECTICPTVIICGVDDERLTAC